MIFGIVLETDPLKLASFPTDVAGWLLTAGGACIVALVIWFLFRLVNGPGPTHDATARSGLANAVLAAVLGLGLMVLPAGLQLAWNAMGWSDRASVAVPSVWEQTFGRQQQYLVSPFEGAAIRFVAAWALAVVLLPVLGNFRQLSLRRIGALAKLSFKEAIRRRVLLVFFLLMLPIFLFAPMFIDDKDEYQVRTYVNTIFTAMTFLLLITTALLASYCIPNDLKNQSLHTIVTKPVERLEIVLGRFIGYMGLITLLLAVISVCSLVLLTRNISVEAREQSYKARVPIYGDLQVSGGKNVGYEWEYRQYITVPDKPEEPEFALWTFPDVPAELGKRDDPSVRCEFTFDIFRTTKGREEGKGILVSFLFENWKAEQGKIPGTPARLEEYRRERERLIGEATGEKFLSAIDNELAAKYGFYWVPEQEITDFHTLHVDVPTGLFRNIGEYDAEKRDRPPLQVMVRCTSRTQYLGVAKHDFYILDSTRGFEQNFFKASFGLWLLLCLVAGVAITFSTFLSGNIAFLATLVVLFMGSILRFARSIVAGQTIGGGSFENAYRLATGAHTSMPLDQSPLVTVVQNLDRVWAWILGAVLKAIPDVGRYNFTRYVEDGFNISGPQLIMTGLLLIGYLLPWVILAYYLMRAREVAS